MKAKTGPSARVRVIRALAGPPLELLLEIRIEVERRPRPSVEPVGSVA